MTLEMPYVVYMLQFEKKERVWKLDVHNSFLE